MSILDSISLFIVMGTLAAIPGTSVALVVTRSATHGVAKGIAVSAGIVTGDLFFIIFGPGFIALCHACLITNKDKSLASGRCCWQRWFIC